ncbi:hypothetical protein MDG893_08706 [Marinobacter algicola DG893]|uniref:Uncharacterized protein n=1 Tax=Marinobacter algicola DG893 TaxID=443152 RepID=A6F254_9GAMM|nr:hypothetical protein MDG893_08706 [Marinobacter algicola DG893]
MDGILRSGYERSLPSILKRVLNKIEVP